MRIKFRSLAIFLYVCMQTALAQTTPTALMVTRYTSLTSSSNPEGIGVGVMDNRNTFNRTNDYESIFCSGTGTWSAAINYSDSSSAGPWTSFGTGSSINQGTTPIAYGFGYHPWIQVAITGSSSCNFSAWKQAYVASLSGSLTFPISIGQGGTSNTTVIGAKGSTGLNLVEVNSTDYNFTPQSPGGSLISGGINQTITMVPCPLGVNATDTGHQVYLSGGSGGPEAVTINGGTCVSGAASGVILVTPLNSHSGAWTVSSATNGTAEAAQYLSSLGGGVVTVPHGGPSYLGTLSSYPTVVIIDDRSLPISPGIRASVQTNWSLGGADCPGFLGGIYPTPVAAAMCISASVPPLTTLGQQNALALYVEESGAQNTGYGTPTTLLAAVRPLGSNVTAFAANLITGNSGTNNTGVGVEIDMSPDTGHPFVGQFGILLNAFGEHSPGYGIGLGAVGGGLWDGGLSLAGMSEGSAGVYVNASPSHNICGAANNGSGLIRITLCAGDLGSDLNTGQSVTNAAVGGVSAANGNFVLTRVTTGIYDLQGSTFSGSYTSGGTMTRRWSMGALLNANTNATFLFDPVLIGNNLGVTFVNSGTCCAGARLYNNNSNVLQIVSGISGTTAFRNGTDNGPGNITANAVQYIPSFSNTLPSCDSSHQGWQQFVKDASTNVWGSIFIGGGANPVMALCNGTNWTVMGK